MWKRSFIFLAALALGVSSLCAYPAFFYGGAKEEIPAVVEALPEEVSTEELEKSTPDLNSSPEESAPEASDKSEGWDDTKSVVELLEEARVKQSVIDKVKAACSLIDEGREEMVAAYTVEVDAREKAEKEAERVHYVFMPLVSYKPSVHGWGAGLAVGIETKNLVIQVQALKPVANGLDSFKGWDDTTIVLGAGLRF